MVLLLVACAEPPEAPEDLDGLFHWFFAHHDTATDEEMRAAATNFAAFAAQEGDGTLSPLAADEQVAVTIDPPRDPAEASGLYVSGPIACPLADVERIRYALDQEGLYEAAADKEMYVSYDRAYTSDIDAYVARETPFVTWHTDYTVDVVFSSYTASVEGGLRYVPEADGVGPLVIERNWFPAPAVDDAENDEDFAQDYQINVHLPDGDGTIHGYALWRDITTIGLSDEDASLQGMIIDGFHEFDTHTETVCANEGF